MSLSSLCTRRRVSECREDRRSLKLATADDAPIQPTVVDRSTADFAQLKPPYTLSLPRREKQNDIALDTLLNGFDLNSIINPHSEAVQQSIIQF